jgi:hypothetical protein
MGDNMNGRRIHFFVIGVAAWISLLLMITTAYCAGLIIGGNHTNIGTILLVSPNPGDSAHTSGTALLNTLAGITADVNNRYVIKLGPGVYDIGTSSLQMKQYVDVEGSGEKGTIILGTVSNPG